MLKVHIDISQLRQSRFSSEQNISSRDSIKWYRGGDLGETAGDGPLLNLRWETALVYVLPIFRNTLYYITINVMSTVFPLFYLLLDFRRSRLRWND